jgi:hypothetical protein
MRDLLVHLALHDAVEDLPFAWCQTGQQFAEPI